MSAHSGFVTGDTKKIEREDQLANSPSEKHASTEQQPFRTEPMESRHWQGKLVRVAVGRTTENGQQMSVPFAVLNASGQTIEVLPPQIQLAGTSKDKYRKAIKAEPVAVRDYRITTRRLGPGERADGVVVFDRPSFKESERTSVAGGCPSGGSGPSGAGADRVCGSDENTRKPGEPK